MGVGQVVPPLPPGATLDRPLPPLPSGATLDHPMPPLPPGAKLDSAPAADESPHIYDIEDLPASSPLGMKSAPKPPGEEDKRIYQMAVPIVEGWKKSGNEPSLIDEARSPFLRSVGIDPAAASEAKNRMFDGTLQGFQEGAQMAMALPFGGAQKPSDEERALSMAQDIWNSEKAGQSFPHALYQGGVGIAGMTGALALAKGVLPEAVTPLGAAAQRAGTFGAYSAVPALQKGQFGQAAGDFVKGAALGGALEGVGNVAEKLPDTLANIVRPAAQGGVITGAQALEGQNPTARDWLLNTALMAPMQFLPEGTNPFGGKTEKPKYGVNLTEPTPEQVSSAKPQEVSQASKLDFDIAETHRALAGVDQEQQPGLFRILGKKIQVLEAQKALHLEEQMQSQDAAQNPVAPGNASAPTDYQRPAPDVKDQLQDPSARWSGRPASPGSNATYPAPDASVPIARHGREAGAIFPSRSAPAPETPESRQLQLEDELVKSKHTLFFPQYADVAENSPDAYVANAQALASNARSRRQAGVTTQQMWDTAGGNPDVVDLAVRKLQDTRYQWMKAQGRNPDKALQLTQAEQARYDQNKDAIDPVVKVASDFNKNQIAPDLADAGVNARAVPEDVPFASLVPLRSEESSNAAVKRARRAGLSRAYIETTQPEDAPGPSSAPGGIGGLFRNLNKRSGKAQAATGESPRYATEPYTVLYGGKSAVDAPAAHNRYIRTLRAEAAKISPEDIKAGSTMYGGNRVKLVDAHINQEPKWLRSAPTETGEDRPIKADEKVMLPEPISKMWEDYLHINPKQAEGAIGKASHLVVGTAMQATAAEPFIHVVTGLDQIAQLPGLGRTVAERVAAKVPLLRTLVAQRNVVDMTDPANQAVMKRLENAGMLRSREIGPQSTNALQKNWPSRFVSQFVFHPGGYEDAIKTTILKWLDTNAPKLTEAQKLYTVGNLSGVFTEGLQPKIVQMLRGPLSPFAQMGTTKARVGMQRLGGVRPDAEVTSDKGFFARRSLDIFTRIPSIVAATLAVKVLLDDKHDIRAALEDPTGIEIAGKRYDLLRVIEPISSAALRIAGIAQGIGSLAMGRSPMKTLASMASGPINYAAGYIGQLPRAAAALGNVGAYVTADEQGLHVPPAGPISQYPITSALKRGGAALMPGYNTINAFQNDPEMSMGRNSIDSMLGLIGVQGTAPKNPRVELGQQGNLPTQQLKDIAAQLAGGSRSMSYAKATAFINDNLDRVEPQNRSLVRSEALRIWGSMQKSTNRGLSKIGEK